MIKSLSANLVEQGSRMHQGKSIDFKHMHRVITQAAASSVIGQMIPAGQTSLVAKVTKEITLATGSALAGAAIDNQHHIGVCRY